MIQMSIIQKRHYHINSIDERDYSEIVWQRKKKLEQMEVLLGEGCAQDIVLQTLEISSATYHRWKKNYREWGLVGLENESKRPRQLRSRKWTREVELRVYHLRKQYQLWGKKKITKKYIEQYGYISESTVGRILSKLLKKGDILSVRLLADGKRDKKPRMFTGHAQRLKYGMKAQGPGQFIQVDHMTESVTGLGTVKHFNAVCPITKYAVAQVYRQATSSNAAEFLRFMQEQFPFPIRSIQVDGGSEFMSSFEAACKEVTIPLYVLPPRRPQLNGVVERMNRTFQIEFYGQYDKIPSLHLVRKNLQKYAYFYNFKRPHQAINLLTPQQFFELMKKQGLHSHMY